MIAFLHNKIEWAAWYSFCQVGYCELEMDLVESSVANAHVYKTLYKVAVLNEFWACLL